MKLSIVIPVLNRWRLTDACLRSLRATCQPLKIPRQQGPLLWEPDESFAELGERLAEVVHDEIEFEFIIVDNGSTDETGAMLAAIDDPRFKVITRPANEGFAHGCNRGLWEATGDYVVFLNNDTEALPHWWVPLVVRLRDDPTLGVVGALLWYPGKVRTVQHAGMVWTRAGSMLKVQHLYRHKRREHEPGISRPKPLQQVTGACMALRTADARRLEGFCTDYVNGYEDVDLCFRARRELGLATWYEPKAELVHHESQSAGRSLHEEQNERLFLERWRDAIEVDAVRVLTTDRGWKPPAA